MSLIIHSYQWASLLFLPLPLFSQIPTDHPIMLITPFYLSLFYHKGANLQKRDRLWPHATAQETDMNKMLSLTNAIVGIIIVL
jgi:hypothetical protein